MAKEYPSDKMDQYMVRFPDGMRDHLKEMAARNKRSLNAEIIARLTDYLALMQKQPHYALAMAERDTLAKDLAKTQELVRTLQADLATERQKIDMMHERHAEYRELMESKLAAAKLTSISESLLKRVEHQASSSGRTPREEITQALEAAFPPPPPLKDIYLLWETYKGFAEDRADLFGQLDLATRVAFFQNWLDVAREQVAAGKYSGDGLGRIEKEIGEKIAAEQKKSIR